MKGKTSLVTRGSFLLIGFGIGLCISSHSEHPPNATRFQFLPIPTSFNHVGRGEFPGHELLRFYCSTTINDGHIDVMVAQLKSNLMNVKATLNYNNNLIEKLEWKGPIGGVLISRVYLPEFLSNSDPEELVKHTDPFESESILDNRGLSVVVNFLQYK